jgi:hypothetical protein
VSQIRRGGAETLNPLARTSRLPFRLVTDTATLIEANAALDSGERIASVYRRLNIAEAFGTNETQFRYYANNRHRYPPPVLPAAPSASAAEPDLRSLDDRIHTFGRLMQKVSAAFKDFDSGKLKHDQRLLITALAGEALASRPARAAAVHPARFSQGPDHPAHDRARPRQSRHRQGLAPRAPGAAQIRLER